MHEPPKFRYSPYVRTYKDINKSCYNIAIASMLKVTHGCGIQKNILLCEWICEKRSIYASNSSILKGTDVACG